MQTRHLNDDTLECALDMLYAWTIKQTAKTHTEVFQQDRDQRQMRWRCGRLAARGEDGREPRVSVGFGARRTPQPRAYQALGPGGFSARSY